MDVPQAAVLGVCLDLACCFWTARVRPTLGSRWHSGTDQRISIYKHVCVRGASADYANYYLVARQVYDAI